MMGKRRAPILISVFLFTALLHPWITRAVTVDRIVAIVNGEIITSSELQTAVEQAKLGLYAPTPDVAIPQTQPLERDVLDQLIDKKLELQLARKKGVTAEPEEIQRALDDVKQKNGIATDAALQEVFQKDHISLDQYKGVLKDQITILKLINREVKAGVVLSDEEIRSYYNEHLDRFLSPVEYRLHQIFLAIQSPGMIQTASQTAQEVLTQLKNGADFQAMVERYSNGPEAKNGGDLGTLRKAHMLPEIQRAVENLKPGEISEPIQTPVGIHILRLDGVKTAQPRPIEEVKGEIQTRLFQERSADLYEKWLKNLRETAQVEIKF